jgi:hypothetical protein
MLRNLPFKRHANHKMIIGAIWGEEVPAIRSTHEVLL